jgi:hypothetical protein
MITADTITDEQIRELRDDARTRDDRMLVATCDVALTYRRRGWRQRARCAEILNERAKGK